MQAWIASKGARLWKRRWEWLLYGLCVSVPAVAAGPLVHERVIQPDLLRGASWRPSSTYEQFDVEKMLFHTEIQHDPDVVFDFGKVTAFSSLRIENRDDLRERAVPLIVETSSDGVAYVELVRRERVFKVWRPRFPTTTARYLRLRVPGHTAFHLKRVAAYR
jgi:hypothetical protein